VAEDGPLIVAVDGPAGAGKSSTARALARRLGVPYLDTGAMYRAIALLVLEQGIDPSDREAVERLAASARIELVPESDGQVAILAEGEPVEARIRSSAVGSATSKVSAHPGVRERLVRLQREEAARRGAVVEGRDIGTVVFPDTPHKFFLTADPAERARRRVQQLRSAGQRVSPAEIEEEIRDRDRRDSQREHSPLRFDEGYTVIDSTGSTLEEVVEEMRRAIEARGSEAG